MLPSLRSRGRSHHPASLQPSDIHSRAALIEADNDYTGAISMIRRSATSGSRPTAMGGHTGLSPVDGDLDDYKKLG